MISKEKNGNYGFLDMSKNGHPGRWLLWNYKWKKQFHMDVYLHRKS